MAGAARSNGSQAAAEADDFALVVAAQADRRAFGALYERYVAAIYRYCYHRLGTREAAEDATSVVFTKALGALRHYRADGGSFRSWLFVIAHNTVADHVRRARVVSPLFDVEAATGEPGPEAMAISRQEEGELHRLLATLPADQRQVMELRLSGLSSPEVGRILGRSPVAIRSLQFRAVQRLRTALEDAPRIEEKPHVLR